MKLRYFLVATLMILTSSCKKNGGSGLSIKLESVSSNIIPDNGSLSVVLSFTDNGGHAIDTVVMRKFRINQNQVPTLNDTIYLTPPNYPGNTKGQVQLDLEYNGYLVSAQQPPHFGNPPQDESDSLIIKFVAIDNAGNKSDTASTGLIIVQRVN
jgi:hypothetical protein